jgi:hypothetical protein
MNRRLGTQGFQNTCLDNYITLIQLFQKPHAKRMEKYYLLQFSDNLRGISDTYTWSDEGETGFILIT